MGELCSNPTTDKRGKKFKDRLNTYRLFFFPLFFLIAFPENYCLNADFPSVGPISAKEG
jgi:hypothetical protein